MPIELSSTSLLMQSGLMSCLGLLVELGLLVSLAGCGDTGESSTGSDGAETGGVGATSAIGGANAAGGSVGFVGGGPAAGASGSGGVAATGGEATGGMATGGVATGGASSGGAPAGGASTGGAATGGASTGGATSTQGCGAAAAPQSGRFSIAVDGTTREYILAVPDDYDPNQSYQLVFGWHWRGGSAQDVAGGTFGGGYYGLERLADGSAIFVAPEGIDQGWANTGGRDIAFLEAMLDRFRSELCIDEGRIFSTGFSYGGMMSFAVGCAMGGVFRAIAPMSGALYSGCAQGGDPVAVWGAHGLSDDVVPIGDGRSGRDEFLERNGCGSATTPVDPSPCVSYEGCAAGYPVVWCEFDGGHTMPSNSGASIWAFFSQF